MDSQQEVNVLVTGSSGALGSHVWLRMLEVGFKPSAIDLRRPEVALGNFKHVMHLAGINRGPEDELLAGNLKVAKQLTEFLDSAGSKPEILVFANSAQAVAGDSPYAEGKARAASHLEAWCNKNNVKFVNHFLPNLMGEFGKPFSNMVSTTIVSQLAHEDSMPQMNDSKFQVATLQEAAEALCAFDKAPAALPTTEVSAANLAERAQSIWSNLLAGVDFQGADAVDKRLWAMLVAEEFDRENPKLSPQIKADSRGEFVEIGRRMLSDSQVSLISFSPGAERGNHFHRYLVEDFYLIEGLVKVEFGEAWRSNGEEFSTLLNPGEKIRFPIGWWHRFTDLSNGSSKLLVLANRIFDSENPDTVPWGG